jgi:DNA-binding response OmpR family regulator
MTEQNTITPDTARIVRENCENLATDDALAYALDMLDQFSALHFGGAFPLDSVDVRGQRRKLLELLYQNKGKPVSKDRLYTAITHDKADADELQEPQIVKVQICKLRPKLKGTPYVIRTIWGMGYQLNEVAQ